MCNIWQPVIRVSFVWLLTPERCREGCVCVCVCVCVWVLFVAGGQPDNNKGPALNLSPMIFQLSEKLLWYWKKVKKLSMVCANHCLVVWYKQILLEQAHLQFSGEAAFSRPSHRARRWVSPDRARAARSGPEQFAGDLPSSINCCDPSDSVCWCRKMSLIGCLRRHKQTSTAVLAIYNKYNVELKIDHFSMCYNLMVQAHRASSSCLCRPINTLN